MKRFLFFPFLKRKIDNFLVMVASRVNEISRVMNSCHELRGTFFEKGKTTHSSERTLGGRGYM